MAQSPALWTRVDWLVAASLALAMILLRLPYSIRTDIFFHSDAAIAGLQALQMLQGEWRAFIWGHNYHGTFVSGVIAATLWLTDWPLMQAIQVPPLLFQAAHVVVAYGFLRELLGRWEALAYAVLTLLPTRLFLFYTVRTTPNYGEVLTLGMASLWVILRIHRTEQRSRGLFFLWGFVCGFGMWLLMYITEFIVVALVFLALRWCFAPERLDRDSPLRLSRMQRYWRERGALWAVPGWFVGYAPVIIHLSLGRSTFYHFRLADPAQMLRNLALALRAQIAHFVNPPQGWPAFATVIGVAAYGCAVLSLIWVGVRWWRETFQNGELSEPLLLWLLLPVSWGMYIMSYWAWHGPVPYLWPYQLVVPFAVVILAREAGGWISDLRLRRWISVAVLGAFLLFNAAVAATDFRRPVWRGPQAVLALLEREGVEAGFADYWVSYHLTALADEKIIIAPFKFLDRYLPYTLFALLEPRVALILRHDRADEAEQVRAREFSIRGRSYRQQGADYQVHEFIVKFLVPIAPFSGRIDPPL